MANENETVEQVYEMSLDFAINHAQEAGNRLVNKSGCESCGKEHLQLAEWLRELKEARKIIAAKDTERLTVSANYEAVIAAKDRIIEAKDAEIAKLRNELSRVRDITGDCRKCEECGDESCPWFGEPDGCNNREAREKFLRGELVNPIKERDALIKELADTLEKKNDTVRECNGICKACRVHLNQQDCEVHIVDTLVAKAREVVK